MLRPIQEAEKYETASRVLMVVRQVCVYAIATGRITHNIAASVRPALTQAPPSKHFAAATDPKEIGPLLRMIDGYAGSPVVLAALRLAPLVFTRPGELRHAKWADIDLDAAEWRFRVSKTQDRSHRASQSSSRSDPQQPAPIYRPPGRMGIPRGAEQRTPDVRKRRPSRAAIPRYYKGPGDAPTGSGRRRVRPCRSNLVSQFTLSRCN